MSESALKRIMQIEKDALALQDEERTALAALQDVRARLRDCVEKAVEERYGVKRGSVVVYKGKRYLVVSIDPWHLSDIVALSRSQPWLKGSLYRKDGTLSPHVSTLYTGWSVEP